MAAPISTPATLIESTSATRVKLESASAQCTMTTSLSAATTLAGSTSATRVKSETASAPTSKRRSRYIQRRLERKHQEKEATRNKRKRARKELADHRDRKIRLRQTQESEEQTLLAEKKRLQDIDKEVKEAQAKYQSEKKIVDAMQKSINQIKREIAKTEGSISDCEADLQWLEKELESGLESETAEVTRQADILDMNSAEIEALATYAANNSAFGNNIARAAQDTATPAMIRDIRSEMYDIMTGVTPDEFRELMERVLSLKEALLSEDMAEYTDGDEDGNEGGFETGDGKESGSDTVDPEASDEHDDMIITSRRHASRSLSQPRRNEEIGPSISYNERDIEKQSLPQENERPPRRLLSLKAKPEESLAEHIVERGATDEAASRAKECEVFISLKKNPVGETNKKQPKTTNLELKGLSTFASTASEQTCTPPLRNDERHSAGKKRKMILSEVLDLMSKRTEC
ncbi:uncharacterized protein A1O5_02087 [Cladophialophora psammophila CBS 110553]|uniref:Uncharacterized protein n=1 Tax=Cladophialophora psammophila CBS 110553 TaxID=1182543 RepID=W9XEN8_9EURO|nr:uncharacterized protein A1O5_02087 [Cladophialophora psammophila CBS 110553]EXJ75391.1 hypothetical protein A1O5_02087 [Cladophialophora psammophila CBS 110553]